MRSKLIFFTKVLFFPFTLSGLCSYFFVVLFECGQIFTGFRELAFLHTLSYVPVNECTLGVHKVELVVNAGECFCDGRRVGNHAASAHHTGKISSRNNGRRLIVDATLESSWAPVDELNRALRLDRCDGCVHVFRHDVPTVHEATGHVFAVTRITLVIMDAGSNTELVISATDSCSW